MRNRPEALGSLLKWKHQRSRKSWTQLGICRHCCRRRGDRSWGRENWRYWRCNGAAVTIPTETNRLHLWRAKTNFPMKNWHDLCLFLRQCDHVFEAECLGHFNRLHGSLGLFPHCLDLVLLRVAMDDRFHLHGTRLRRADSGFKRDGIFLRSFCKSRGSSGRKACWHDCFTFRRRDEYDGGGFRL